VRPLAPDRLGSALLLLSGRGVTETGSGLPALQGRAMLERR
jgi:hypothetical protein